MIKYPIAVMTMCGSMLMGQVAPTASDAGKNTTVKAAENPLVVTVECSRKSHLVHTNEPFEFIITANKPKKLKVVVSMDGEAILQRLTVTPPARVKAVLPHPGFVRCALSSFEKDSTPVLCGVGVDPEQLRPLLPEPPDFDEFWANTKAELAAIPADFKMEKYASDSTLNYYRISCDNLNNQKAYGFLSLPVDASKKLPLLVTFPGGEAYMNEESFVNLCAKNDFGIDCARLVYHLPPYQPEKNLANAKARHEQFLKEIGLKRYIFFGVEDRNIFYTRTAVTGCLRLLDEALKQPGLDPERVVYHGASHGGAFGLYLAAFSDKFKAAFCGVPNFGDRGGFLAGRHTPDCIRTSQTFRGHLDTLLYFDTAFAARRIEIPVMIGVGFIDPFCAPSAVYTIYNELKGPKVLLPKIKNGHGDAPPEYGPMTYLWLSKQINN